MKKNTVFTPLRSVSNGCKCDGSGLCVECLELRKYLDLPYPSPAEAKITTICAFLALMGELDSESTEAVLATKQAISNALEKEHEYRTENYQFVETENNEIFLLERTNGGILHTCITNGKIKKFLEPETPNSSFMN